MWLLRGAILVIFASIPVQLYPVTSSEHINTTSAPVNSLSSIHIEGPRSESPNVTHSYTEDSTVIDSNTTDVSSNTIDDQLVEATSSTRNKICTLCTVDYNATEINNITTNSSNFTMSNVTSTPEEGFFNVGIIIAITVLVIVIFALIGGLSFFAYRHFAWNRPQTLTDKFSNDESTGYIDDTAFRENSEEMYSLDNDSFLNSLEAMTIQNYWTDHVRHTKL